MDIQVKFPGGKRVDAAWGSQVIHTDQSVEHGGDGSAPEPFEVFLASLATCAGIYVLGFCQSRDIPAAGIVLTQRHTYDASGRILTRVDLEVSLPPGFPDKYRGAVIQAADGCKVKRLLAAPPEIVVAAA